MCFFHNEWQYEWVHNECMNEWILSVAGELECEHHRRWHNTCWQLFPCILTDAVYARRHLSFPGARVIRLQRPASRRPSSASASAAPCRFLSSLWGESRFKIASSAVCKHASDINERPTGRRWSRLRGFRQVDGALEVAAPATKVDRLPDCCAPNIHHKNVRHFPPPARRRKITIADIHPL